MKQEHTKETIIYNSLIKFCLSDDCKEQKRLYQNTVKQIQDSSAISKICEIEKLLKKKTSLEILFVYQKGLEKIEKNGKHFDNTDLDTFCLEDLGLDILYCNNLYYIRLENSLKDLRNQLRNFAKNQIESDCIESLFQIYSFCNYEILKYSYFTGAVLNSERSNIFYSA